LAFIIKTCPSTSKVATPIEYKIVVARDYENDVAPKFPEAFSPGLHSGNLFLTNATRCNRHPMCNFRRFLSISFKNKNFNAILRG